MASYKDPIIVTYTRTVAGETPAAWTVAPPPGCNKVRLVDINASVITTSFVGETTPAMLAVGVPTNPTVLGVLSFGTKDAPSQAGAVLGWQSQVKKTGVTGANPIVPVIDLTGASNPAAVTSPYPAAIEALGPVSISMTASTGGSPAGNAICDVVLAWF